MHNDECRSKVNNMSDRNTGSPTLALCMSDIIFGKEKKYLQPWRVLLGDEQNFKSGGMSKRGDQI